LRIEYVSLATIAERHRAEIDHMKKFFCVFYPEGFMHNVDGRLLHPNRKYEQGGLARLLRGLWRTAYQAHFISTVHRLTIPTFALFTDKLHVS
jgi:hypothetical protein